MSSETVARHDVEANAGQERHALRLGFGVPRGKGFEDVDFAGDVEVVDAIAKAGVRYRFRRRRERTGDAEHRGNVLDRRINSLWIVKVKRASGKPERFGDGFDLIEISSGEDRTCALARRHPCDQLAGVAGRAVDQDSSAQTSPPPANKPRMPRRPTVVLQAQQSPRFRYARLHPPSRSPQGTPVLRHNWDSMGTGKAASRAPAGGS
jgi:hypothetical protein